MQIIGTAPAMHRLALEWRKRGALIALVPTMGCLHEGHLSLLRRARREIGPRGKLAVSIFVNPTQFGPGEDYLRYPRDAKRDFELCRSAGVDAVFAPAAIEMYPGGVSASSTWVVEESLSTRMEGASRPGHFRGVTTVVAKLFNILQPDAAVFGSKDFQQTAVIRRMVRDLNFFVKIIVAPTVREKDGLAMSSRNAYLKHDSRTQALVLWRSLQLARARIAKSKSLPAARLKAQIRKLVAREPAARLDYVEFFDPHSLVPSRQVRRGTHMAMAVWLGQTRLIDNSRL